MVERPEQALQDLGAAVDHGGRRIGQVQAEGPLDRARHLAARGRLDLDDQLVGLDQDLFHASSFFRFFIACAERQTSSTARKSSKVAQERTNSYWPSSWTCRIPRAEVSSQPDSVEAFS